MSLLPCEYSTNYFLPRLRQFLAIKLYEKGTKQKTIAEILHVSQPVISSYLKKKVKGDYIPEWICDVGEKILSTLKPGQVDYSLLIQTTCRECRLTRISGPICTLHKQNCQFLMEDCTLCHADSYEETEEITGFLRDLDRKIRALVGLAGFYKLVPEIGSQIALQYREQGAVSFPGRLIRVKNSVRILAFPEFRHTGTLTRILKFVRQKDPSISGIFAIKNTKAFLKKLEEKKDVVRTNNGDSNWETALSDEYFLDTVAIADSGGLGFEPIIYILGNDLDSLISIVNVLIEDLKLSLDNLDSSSS
ncbi:MAG: thiamine-phosphate synthase family protein [Candidatus Hodarchaeales archaeon]